MTFLLVWDATVSFLVIFPCVDNTVLKEQQKLLGSCDISYVSWKITR
jgi:hypothetical protein